MQFIMSMKRGNVVFAGFHVFVLLGMTKYIL